MRALLARVDAVLVQAVIAAALSFAHLHDLASAAGQGRLEGVGLPGLRRPAAWSPPGVGCAPATGQGGGLVLVPHRPGRLASGRTSPPPGSSTWQHVPPGCASSSPDGPPWPSSAERSSPTAPACNGMRTTDTGGRIRLTVETVPAAETPPIPGRADACNRSRPPARPGRAGRARPQGRRRPPAPGPAPPSTPPPSAPASASPHHSPKPSPPTSPDPTGEPHAPQHPPRPRTRRPPRHRSNRLVEAMRIAEPVDPRRRPRRVRRDRASWLTDHAHDFTSERRTH